MHTHKYNTDSMHTLLIHSAGNMSWLYYPLLMEEVGFHTSFESVYAGAVSDMVGQLVPSDWGLVLKAALAEGFCSGGGDAEGTGVRSRAELSGGCVYGQEFRQILRAVTKDRVEADIRDFVIDS